MLKDLKFVQGAVAKKDFLPAMTHFVIENETVRAFNGSMALSAPIKLDITCRPKAVDFVRAISNCKDDAPPALSMTPAGRLRVVSGDFKAFIECVNEETPHVLPEGERVDFDGDAMIRGLKAVAPFIGEDASRPWCNGVLMRGESMYATNNVICVQYWTGAAMPITINVPRAAIAEMLRINEAPTHAQVTSTSITFHYSDGRWIRTQLLDVAWPDVDKLLGTPCDPKPFDQRVFEALDKLKGFADKIGRVFIEDGVLSTVPVNKDAKPEDEDKEGRAAAFKVPGLTWTGCYAIEMLKLLEGIADTADFTTYPRPCNFYAKPEIPMRGSIIGLRL